MSSFKGSTVLITGGASGIGKLMGRLAIERGASSLVLWDIDKKSLDRTVQELSGTQAKVKGFVVDVSDVGKIQSTAATVKKKVGAVDILINNAGIVVGKYFNEHSHSDIQRTMEINASSHMHLTLEFLPSMIERKKGHILNIASAAGMVGNPKMPVYAASKWAMIGWSDSLRLEMEKLKSNVKVTCATPYYISTGMFDGVQTSIFIPINKPESAARKIIDAVEKDKLFVRMPPIVYILPFVKGILPARGFDLIVGKFLKVYRTMDEFTGRK